MLPKEIYHSKSDYSSLVFSGGELKVKESGFSTGYGVRILEDGRLGFGYCQDENLEKALSVASRLSKFSSKSSFSFAPESKYQSVVISDPKIDPYDYETIKSFVDQAYEGAESRGGKSRVICSMENRFTSIKNTSGFFGEYSKTGFSIYVECMDGDGFGYKSFSSSKAPQNTHSIGNEAAEMARAMKGAKKPESGKYSLVMEIEAIETLLEILLPSFSGDWKRRSISRIEVGKKSFSDLLTMHDDPLSPGINTHPFDDEGIPSSKRTLVENGVIQSFLYDRETAALSGVEECGSCNRESYSSQPSLSSSNIVISPGSLNNFDELDNYLEVHSAHGSHTANPTTGDFGLEASTAFLVNKGKRTPVRGFMISGNIFDFFSKISGMEKKQNVHGSLISPRIAFSDVDIIS